MASPDPQFATFSLSIRRADGIPFGLKLSTDQSEQKLVVEALQPGGAAEAWNRQSAGDFREIRVGDRVVAINDVQGAAAMLRECEGKFLVKLVIERKVSTN